MNLPVELLVAQLPFQNHDSQQAGHSPTIVTSPNARAIV